MRKSIVLCAAMLAIGSGAARAAEPPEQMAEFVNTTVRGWFADPAVQYAVTASNAAHDGKSEAELVTLDDAWRAEISRPDRPTIDAITGSAVSAMLRDRVAGSGGVISEIILMDNRGMNVAVSDVTSDFWQGDEAKYQDTYPKGPGAVHLSDIELDESSQTYQLQYSFTLTDASGAPIGAVTIGLNAEAF